MRKIHLLALLLTIGIQAIAQKTHTFWLDDMDLTKIHQGWSEARKNQNLRNGPIKLGGTIYPRGVATHAYSNAMIDLRGGSLRFKATVGIEDTMAALKGYPIEVLILGDSKELYNSGIIKPGDKPGLVDIDVKGVKLLELHIKGIGGTHHAHASWGNAHFTVVGADPVMYVPKTAQPYILTPKPAATPRINGAKVFGVRPGSPFLYTIAATGERPLTFEAKNLPKGLALDGQTGRITGSIKEKGTYMVTLAAKNSKGKTERAFKIVVGDVLALTPPMGWNSWNAWGMAVDQEKVKQAADFMVSSGLADHGWTYVNIDDGWEGPQRDSATMEITTDAKKFPDMKALTDYVHGKGLKMGIYSSPGKKTCGNRLGSLQHEDIDAQTYARWGIDYLKYDWCSYGDIAPRPLSDYAAQLPYRIMQKALTNTNRDIVYSLCQYGMNDVWKWGDRVNGNAWRTTGDIIDTWHSMREIGFFQMHCAPYTKPGRWNDPDMLVVGHVGWGPTVHPTRLTPNEQYTHISLWSLLSSPLLIGCDMSKLDAFTLNLLTNDEVIDVNQDPAGKPAFAVMQNNTMAIYAKPLEDGSVAVGLFNLTYAEQNMSVNLKDLKISGKHTVRDLWRQKDLGVHTDMFTSKVSDHGVVFIKLTPKQ